MGRSTGLFCGIDLGTTNSTVSVINIQSRIDEPLEKLEVSPIYQYDENYHFDRDSVKLPSTLYFNLDKKQAYTGKYAKSIYGSGNRPMQTVRSVKTRIGGESLVEIPEIDNPENKEYFDMIQCSALFLKTILKSLEAHYEKEIKKNKVRKEDIKEAVITVPAAFNNDEREATIAAAKLAGFEKCDILDEPTAALLYNLNKEEDILSIDEFDNKGEYKMVYDLGGGTLDVCIAKISEGEDEGELFGGIFGDDEDKDAEDKIEIDIIARSPRMDLGGDDFDQYLGASFLAEYEKIRRPIQDRTIEEQNQIIARIVSQAEEYKIEMNNEIKKKLDKPRSLKRLKKYVAFELIDDMHIPDIKLTKNKLEDIYKKLIKTKNAKILEPIKRVLSEAKLKKNKISEVLFTGGMSNFYAVEETLRSFFGNQIKITPIDRVSAVSKGAAMHKYSLEGNSGLEGLKLKDRMADDIFIKVGNKFEKLISRDIEPGSEGTFDYKVPSDNLADLPIFLYYGLGNDPASYTAFDGKFISLNAPLKKGEIIELKWNLDKDKVVSIEVSDEKLKDDKIETNNNTFYTEEEIKNDFIHQLELNGGKI